MNHNTKVSISIVVGVVLFFVTICILASAPWEERQREYYNQNDLRDFSNGLTIRFDVLQFDKGREIKNIKTDKLEGSGGYFLFMGRASVKQEKKETVENNDYYYALVKNINGGTYFAKIPVNKTRIYQDAKTNEIAIVASSANGRMGRFAIKPHLENWWGGYEYFNMHVPEGTIIKTLDNPEINLKMLLQKDVK